MIVALHVATGAAAGAASGSPLKALLIGPVLHLAGDRLPHEDIHSARFEIGSGLAGLFAPCRAARPVRSRHAWCGGELCPRPRACTSVSTPGWTKALSRPPRLAPRRTFPRRPAASPSRWDPRCARGAQVADQDTPTASEASAPVTGRARWADADLRAAVQMVGDREAPEGPEMAVRPVAASRGSAPETGRGWEAPASGWECRGFAKACWDRPYPGYSHTGVEGNDHRRLLNAGRMPTANLSGGGGGGRPAVRNRRGRPAVAAIRGCPPERSVKLSPSALTSRLS